MTLAELRDSITHYVENEDEPTFDSMLDTFIVNAETVINASGLVPTGLQTSTTALVSGTPTYTVPAGFLRPMHFSVNPGTGRYVPLLLKDESFLRSAFPSRPSGFPRYYARSSETAFSLSHNPDQNYAVEFQYYGYPASITVDAAGDSATSWLSLYAPNALLYGSIVEAYVFLKGEQDVMAMYTGKFTEAMGLLKNTVDGFANQEAHRHDVVRTQPQ